MEKHADAVNEATGGFSKQFAEIVSTFEGQSELFNSVAEKHRRQPDHQMSRLPPSAKAPTASLPKMSALEEEVVRRGSAVADKSNVAIDKLSEIDQAIAERILKLDQDLSPTYRAARRKSPTVLSPVCNNSAKSSNRRNRCRRCRSLNCQTAWPKDWNSLTGAGQTKNDAGETADQIVERLGAGLETFNRAISDSRTGSDDAAAAIAENTARIREVHQAFRQRLHGAGRRNGKLCFAD